MRADILRRGLADQWRSVAAWCAGFGLLALLYTSVYSSIHSSGLNLQQLIQQLPEALRNAFFSQGVDFTSPEGYIGTELLSVLGPAIMVALGVTAGARAVAGEESLGTVDLLLGRPVTRARLVVEKSLSAALPLLAVAATAWIVVVVVGRFTGLIVGLGLLALSLFALALLGMCFGMLALLIAAATGSRGTGAGVAGAIAVALFALNAIAPSLTALQGVDHVISPFHWTNAGAGLVSGIPAGGLVALLLCPPVLVALGVAVYARRDIG